MQSGLRSPVLCSLTALATIGLFGVPHLGAQQAGTITGQIEDAESGEALSSVQVYLSGLDQGVLSQQNGRFLLQNVPAGNHALTAERIGYRTVSQQVTVPAGETVVVDLTMSTTALMLEEIVATGLVDPVEGVRSPITVNRVTREMMPVTASGSAVQNLQGRVPGLSMNRGSGQPGTGTNLMLRTPTSVTQAGNPLMVVDGVILGTMETTNIESLDIESMEVIKGAAAASLYGSRAAAGVIAIQTARGNQIAEGQTRFSARAEMGRTQTLRTVDYPTHHHYLVDDDQNPTSYVDQDGNPVSPADRTTTPIAFMDKPYPGPVYDNLGSVFRPGNFESYNLSVSQNSATTNFQLSANRRVERGALENNDGYELNSFRMNLDHRFLDAMSLGVSAYHSRDWRDNVVASFQDIMNAPVDVDLSEKDENGQYARVVGSAIPYENPIWLEASRDDERNRARTLASANLRWEPYTWMTFMGNVSYDRLDAKNREYTAKGVPTSITSPDTHDGEIVLEHDQNDTWNGEAQVSLRRDFGPLNVRTTLRSLLERERNEETEASGENFFVGGVPSIDAAADRDGDSEENEIRATGYLWDTAFDYDGKYILTVLGRRDGSSLFGPDNRWHNYYRVAGAYRIGQESWFDLPHVDEFKLSYARGTAGGRPGFSAQYETWNVSSTGLSKGALGNRELRPEHTTEQEVSLETILFNRVGLDLTHAWQRTEDQLVNAAVPGITGYSSQWSNGGTVTGYSTELALEAQVVQGADFNWSASVTADRSRGKIEDWPFACQNPTWRYFCSGVGIYEVWGGRFVRSHDDLATHHGGAAADHSDEFDVNDDGYLVWVGEGNAYTDQMWGEESEPIGGRTYQWGMPFMDAAEDGSNRRQQIGDGSHVNLGWQNNFSYRGLTLHTHLHAVIGGDAINRSHQEMVTSLRYPAMDQSGKPEELKKPTAYYTALEGGTGNDAWMEDGSYVKLRTVSLTYRLDQSQMNRIGLGNLGMESMTLELTGRNIFTITDYTGFDPEQALNLGNRQNQDRFGYPNTRNMTAAIQLTF